MQKHFPLLAEGSLRSTRVSDLFDKLHSFLDFLRIIILSGRHRDNLNLKEFNCILQPYRFSLSYIKGRSDFQAKDLKRESKTERDLKSTAADRNSITIFYINAIKQKRPFYRCFE